MYNGSANSRSKFSHIRGCMVMDLAKDLPMCLEVDLEGVFPFCVDVQYKKILVQCALYKQEGHFLWLCPTQASQGRLSSPLSPSKAQPSRVVDNPIPNVANTNSRLSPPHDVLSSLQREGPMS